MAVERQSFPIMTAAQGAFATAPAEGTDYGAFYSSLGCKGLVLHVSINSGTTFSLTFTIKQYNILTGEATDTLLASAAKSTNVNFELTIFPGITETANVDAATVLGEYWMLDITGTTDTCTLDIQADLIP